MNAADVVESGTVDGGPGADASDAGSTMDATEGSTTTETFASSGWIQVYPFAFQANFFLDDDIVRMSSAPECVLRFRNTQTIDTCVGNLNVGGDYFGQDGGPPAGVINIPCNVGLGGNSYGPGLPTAPDGGPASWVYYPEAQDIHLQLSTDGMNTGIPDLPVTTLHTPAFSAINFTAPAEPDGGACNVGGFTIPHDQPFQIQWAVPDAGVSDQRVAVALYGFLSPSPSVYDSAEIWCGYPLSAGQATIPADVLTEVWNRLGGATDAGEPLSFELQVTEGDQREVVVNGASFVITVQNSSAMLFSGDCAPIGQIPATMQ